MSAKQQRCVWSTDKARELGTREVEQPGKGEILVRNVAVASNPKDWKVPLWSAPYHGVEGNDVAGTVEAVGEGVTAFKAGQRVAAYTRMRTKPRYGAYQELSIADDFCAFPLADHVAYEDAATVPLAAQTAAQGLFRELGLAEKAPHGHGAVVVNGGATSVGCFAIQLLKRAGYRVVAVAGSGAALATELGADAVVDYRGVGDDALVGAIRAAAPDAAHVFDCVSTKDTVLTCARSIQKGGKLSDVLYNDMSNLPNGVTGKPTSVGRAYSEADYRDFAERHFQQFGAGLADGSFKPNKVKLMPRGLASVDEGLRLLQDNKVNGQKLVYRIADTPSS